MKKEDASLLIDEVIDDYYEDDGYGNATQHYDEVIEALCQAKDALEKKCEDCISRQAAQAKIKSICEKYGLSYEDGERKVATGGSAYALGHALDDLPSVAPVQEWNLCSERMPLEKCAVLVRTTNNIYSAYLEDEKWYIFGAYDTEVTGVIAWMPLPRYEEEKQKDSETINHETEEEELEHD